MVLCMDLQSIIFKHNNTSPASTIRTIYLVPRYLCSARHWHVLQLLIDYVVYTNQLQDLSLSVSSCLTEHSPQFGRRIGFTSTFTTTKIPTQTYLSNAHPLNTGARTVPTTRTKRPTHQRLPRRKRALRHLHLRRPREGILEQRHPADTTDARHRARRQEPQLSRRTNPGTCKASATSGSAQRYTTTSTRPRTSTPPTRPRYPSAAASTPKNPASQTPRCAAHPPPRTCTASKTGTLCSKNWAPSRYEKEGRTIVFPNTFQPNQTQPFRAQRQDTTRPLPDLHTACTYSIPTDAT